MRDLSKSPSGPSALLLERRIAPRRNTYIEARITFGKTSLNCIIRNVSDTGAKLEVAKVAGIPDVFLLHAPGHRPQTCRVVWRALKELGVEYRPSARSRNPSARRAVPVLALVARPWPRARVWAQWRQPV